jgi:hypothetical protein
MKKFIFISTIVVLAMITSCSEYKYPDLGEGYRLVSDGEYTLELVNAQNNVMIATHILNYAFDSTFIIVSQRPWDVPDVPGIKEMTYDKRNEAFEKSTFQQYWIINKKEKGEYRLDTLTQLARYSNVYGPFDRQEYLQKREELGVPRELKLKE